MDTGESQPAPPEPKLRWYQYRLRSLFVLTLMVAIACSWLATTMQRQRREYAAAEAIKKAGGKVECVRTWLGSVLRDDTLVNVVEVNLAGAAGTDAVLTHLQGLSQLQGLFLLDSKVTDAGLVHLEGLSRLQGLLLCGANFTDAGLVHLRGLGQLKLLALGYTRVTDTGLVHLRGLGQLRTLDLQHTKVTDKGVRDLQKALPNCKILH